MLPVLDASSAGDFINHMRSSAFPSPDVNADQRLMQNMITGLLKK
jgi:hypothetical protein